MCGNCSVICRTKRAKYTWQHVEAELNKAAAGADPRDVSVALRAVQAEVAASISKPPTEAAYEKGLRKTKNAPAAISANPTPWFQVSGSLRYTAENPAKTISVITSCMVLSCLTWSINQNRPLRLYPAQDRRSHRRLSLPPIGGCGVNARGRALSPPI